MTVKQIDLAQIEQELKSTDHVVEFTPKGSRWECRATYVGNIKEYKLTVTTKLGDTKLEAAQAALDKLRANEPELFADRK